MKISVSKPEFTPVTITIENRTEAMNLLKALREFRDGAYRGTELVGVLEDSLSG